MMGQRTADTKGVGWGRGEGMMHSKLQTQNTTNTLAGGVLTYVQYMKQKNEYSIFSRCPSLPLFFFFLVLAVESEWVGYVGDGVKAGGHSQTKGDTSAA